MEGRGGEMRGFFLRIFNHRGVWEDVRWGSGGSWWIFSMWVI